MEERTLSITIGSGDIRHNNRLFKPSNVDHSRTPDNITLVREDIQDAYHRLFNDSVTKYNESQKRNDRKIKNYFDKIYRSKKEKPFYEFNSYAPALFRQYITQYGLTASPSSP